MLLLRCFFFSSRRRHTRCALVTGVQTCALPISDLALVDSIGMGLSRRSFSIRTDSHAAQLACIRAGLGIGVLQTPVGLSDPNLVAVLPEIVVHRLETWLVTHEDLRKSPRVSVVFDHLVTVFTDYARGRVLR